MITGFNTDIEHDGVVYHVQTEDKGLDSPIILSLVYSGGTILASKRSPYADLIEQGFSDEALAERLKRQHRLICAAIHSGRINDLKKMSVRPKPAQDSTVVSEPVETEVEDLETEDLKGAAPASAEEPFEIEYWPLTQQWTPPPPPDPAEVQEAETQFALVEETSEPEYTEEIEEADEVHPDGLAITMLDDEEFYSGERYTLRVLISNWSNGEENPLPSAAVSIKILGTTFRPLIYSLKTESDGVATVATDIPQFNSGRAAVLVRAVVKDQAAELRRVIHPAR
ncbi:MAG TPA: hypothetical protein VFS76_05475 [Pyrinomonadaceae bacterium]|nr:hypothetical protein [Pyrinomonadaceae bacterium]